jgi:hypothetical protein
MICNDGTTGSLRAAAAPPLFARLWRAAQSMHTYLRARVVATAQLRPRGVIVRAAFVVVRRRTRIARR